jgi:hypothetical protein
MSASTISSSGDLGSVSQPPLQESVRTSPRKPFTPRLPQRGPQRLPEHQATDDEILGIGTPATEAARGLTDELGGELAEASAATSDAPHSAHDAAEIPEALRAALDANPELRRAWGDAQAYREAFATPEAARAATAQLADLGRLDALFFSRRPEDHAELARAVAGLDPVAFASLAQAMAALAGKKSLREAPGQELDRREIPRRPENGLARDDNADGMASAPIASQVEFFHSTNDAAVRGVIEAIESQVERLLPEGVSKSARNRVVGEIYRELDTTLRSNRQLGDQMRQAFGSGALDAAHQRAIVSLVTGRARQALPAVARRVLSEWTSTLVAASHDRRSRQRAAERRVDIAGASGGNDGRRSMTPRDVDYARLSDSDILNL